MNNFDKIVTKNQLAKWIKLRQFEYNGFLSVLNDSYSHLLYKQRLHPIIQDINQYSNIFERINEAKRDSMILIYKISKLQKHLKFILNSNQVTSDMRQKVKSISSLYTIYSFKWTQLMKDIQTCITILGQRNAQG